jgi:NADPH:quinone reductase-like Zn-dependent oxidoreductase
VAGTVVEAPDGSFAPGQRVMLQPGLSCGRCGRCLEGRDNECPRYDVLGYQSAGGYAELVRVPAQNLIGLPDAIGFVEAAAFPLTFLTAWHMLIARAALQAGETVLVIGAGSGVGQAAIQIARLHGARVMATAGTPEKLARARELGAFEAVNHATGDVPVAVKRVTDGRGVDVVVEHVGTATWEASLKSLGRGGRLVTCGATSGPRAAIDLRHLFARQLSLLGSYMGGKPELLSAAPLFFEGKLRPVVDEVLPLPAAAEAHRRLEERRQFGKIVLTPDR